MAGAENYMEKMDLLGELTKAQSGGPERNKRRDEGEAEDEGEGMELSLGLSMNGRFGVDPEKTKKLKRSSSVASVTFAGEILGAAAMGARGVGFEVHAPLLRTRSLPVETEEEWRRRKEQQSMRRMEARKKRMEKLKNLNLRVTRDKGECSRDANGGKSELHGAANGDSNDQRFHRSENGEVLESSCQGTIGPLRSGSSDSCDLIEGTNQNVDLSPSIKPSPNSHEPTSQDLEREPKGSNMPYVTTKEIGPNGRRVEGFLYGYKRGESVRIMCVCHGAFLTPKEFVEHGGVQVNVDHPLKHIVVNPSPLL